MGYSDQNRDDKKYNRVENSDQEVTIETYSSSPLMNWLSCFTNINNNKMSMGKASGEATKHIKIAAHVLELKQLSVQW